MISQKTFANEMVRKFRSISEKIVLLRVGVKLEKFDDEEEVEKWLFRELVCGLMWL